MAVISLEAACDSTEGGFLCQTMIQTTAISPMITKTVPIMPIIAISQTITETVRAVQTTAISPMITETVPTMQTTAASPIILEGSQIAAITRVTTEVMPRTEIRIPIRADKLLRIS